MNESTAIDPNMTLDQAVPSKSNYLSKEDVDTPKLVHIAYMTQDQIEANNRLENRTVLHFDGDIKPMILNQTNKELLKSVTGANTVGELKGKEVVLYNDTSIMFQGKLTGGIRIRARRQAPTPPPAPDFDDDIPF